MRLAYEPLQDEEVLERVRRTGVTFLGIEATERLGAWRTMRHVFDVGHDAALFVEVGPFAAVEAYAVAFDLAGDELLTPL